MQRVVVMGPPGSGKSTLARLLGAMHGLPVFHLDQAFWQPGWVKTPTEAFRSEVERLAALPAWVIEGNYTGMLARRLARADTFIHLDVPAQVATLRVILRTLQHRGRVRLGSAAGCADRFEIEFLRFVWSWNRIRRARNLAIVADFPGHGIVLRRAADRSRLLAMAPSKGRTVE